jgi:RNA polymerase primary sigma factor
MDQWSISIRKDLLLPLDRPYKIGFLGDGNKQGLHHVDILIGISNSVQNYRTLPKGCKGLIIGDECHHYGTQNSIKMLEKNYTYRLGITAYLERIADNGVEDIIVPYFGSNEFHYGYAEAIDEEVIAPFEITFIIAEMSDSEKAVMEELNTQITKYNRQLIGKYPNLKNAGTDQFWAQINKLAGFDKGARMFRNLIYKRRSDVVKLKSKFIVYSHLVDLLKRSKGAFGFTQISETADEVVRILSAYRIKCQKLDGKTNQKIRKQVMSSFRSHDIDMLVAPKLLDEGIDVPTANLAIITGRNSSMRQTIQRIGRVVRRKDENGKGYIVIIASKDTIEDPNNKDQEAFYEVFNDSQIKINKFQFPSQINEIEEHFKKWEL